MSASATPARPRVLVVDDNDDAAFLAGELLRLHGYEVKTASDGLAALALVASFDPSMVILDINMPGMNGYDVAKALRGMAARPLLVALTARQEAADVALAFRAGFDHHLAKPATDLVACVDGYFASSTLLTKL